MEPPELTCEQISAQDIPSRYVLGELSEAEQDQFEQHYFECGRCFEAVRIRQSLGGALSRRAGRNWLRWAALAAAAAVLLAVGVHLVWRRSVLTAHIPPAVAPAPPRMDLLAAFDPPLYTAPNLRSPADRRFADAMQRYQQRDWAGAIAGLREVVEENPDRNAARFYLG